MLQDFRYGLRLLFKSPGFTLVAVLTLALGISTTTIMFAVVNGVLLRPLPYKDANRLVHIAEAHNREPGMSFSYPDLQDLVAQNQVFLSVAGVMPSSLTLTGGTVPVQLDAFEVTQPFFSTLGVSPMLGRDFQPQDDTGSSQPVAILSYSGWQRYFGGDRSVIGRAINMSQRSYTVVGVLPKGFTYRDVAVDVYVPLGLELSEDWTHRRSSHSGIYLVARLKPGITLQQAQANLDSIAERLQREYPADNANNWFAPRPLRDRVIGNVRPALLILLGAVGCLLLIACGNVANLLLARATARSKELAIRTALGASRTRLVRQLLSESLLLASLGGGLGILLAVWGTNLLVASAPDALPRISEIQIDARVLLFTAAVSFITGLLFGIAPAMHASGSDANSALKEAVRGSVGGRQQKLRSALVIGELALSLALLVCAGLLIRSFMRVLNVDPGFNPHNVLTATLVISETKYPKAVEAENFFREVLRNINAIPGVIAAGAVTPLPLSGNEWDTDYIIEGQKMPAPGEFPNTEIGYLTPDYLNTVQEQIIAGRGFTEGDNDKSVPVAIVNRDFARHVFGNESPIGKRIMLSPSADLTDPNKNQSPWRTIVGVVESVRQYGLDGQTVQQVYMPYLQPQRLPIRRRDLVIRTAVGNPMSLADDVRKAVARADKDEAVSDFHTMDEYLQTTLASRKLTMALLGAFAGMALALAAIGIYGVVSYWVVQRTREIGIRMALGASAAQMRALVLGQSIRLAAIGAAVGLVAALASSRLLRSLLYEVRPTDVVTLISVSVVLVAVALVASYVPARRASKVDPMVALRYE